MIESNLENAVIGIFDSVVVCGEHSSLDAEVVTDFLDEMLACLREANLTEEQVNVFVERLRKFEEAEYDD